MAKRSIKRPPQLEKNNAGCLWPLISLFDFHKSPPTPRLLSDVRPASSRQGGKGDSRIKLDKPSRNRDKYEDAKNVTGIKAKGDDANFASVKTLMKEEMVRERSNKYKLTSDSDVNDQIGLPNLAGQGSDKITLTNGSSLDSDLIAFLVEFYTDKKSHKDILVNGNNKIDLIAMVQKLNDHPSEFDSRLNQKDYILFKALADVFEAIANQKYVVDMRHLLDNVSQSKEFMEALEIINSNKDVVLKLLKDPDWYIYRCQEAEAGKFDSFGFENYSENVRMLQEDIMSSKKSNQHENKDMGHNQNRPRFFWRKDRSKEKESEKKSEDSENQTRMPVENPTKATKKGQEIKSVRNLSPALQSKTGHKEGDRVMSNFFLWEIKRKIKGIIGGNKKERRVISMDGILHKIPIGHKVPGDTEKPLYNDIVVASSKSKSLHDKEKPPVAKENDSKVNPEDCKPRISNDISAIISTPPMYAEAKKHLADILDTEDQTTISKTARVSKSLAKLFSMQEDGALRMKMSRQDEKEVVLPSEEAGSIPLQKLKEEDVHNSLSPSKQNMEVSSCPIDYLIDEAVLGLKTEFVDKCAASDPDHDESVQNREKSDAINNLLIDQSDNEAGVSCAASNVNLAHSIIQSIPTSCCKENLEAPEKTTTSPGRPIPVSILEKFIAEDFTIPKLRVAHPIFPTKEERTTSRAYFANRRSRVKYIEAILEASGLKSIDFSRWHLADKLLEPSIFYDVGSSCYPQIEDPKLLFDFINEALEEIQENFFKCTPWVSLLSSNVLIAPRGRSLSKEVNRIIERHIPLDFSDSIDPLVTRDMEVGSWMGLQFETEEVVLEIWDTALDDLVEEAIFDLWLDLSADW